jgi:hypothetical protein
VAVLSALAAAAASAGFMAGMPFAGVAEASATPEVMTQPASPARTPPITPRRDGAYDTAGLASRARHSAASSRAIVRDRRQPTTPARRLRIAQPLST